MTWSNSKDPIVFVVPGDLHLTETGLDNHRVACWTIDEANRLIRPDFVQFIGDNVQHASDEQFRLFCGLASRLAVPYFALVGDHDLDGVGTPGRFMNYLGAPYGSTALAGFRFVRLNSQEARPVGFSEFQLDWLEEEFAMAQIAKQRVVLFQHNYPYKVFEEFAGPGVDRWRRIVDEHRVVAIFCGHTHYAQTANDGRNVTIAARSIGDPEGGPPGYLVGFVQGDDLAVKYRTVEDSNSLVLITHPRDALLATSSRHIVRGPDWVRVRTWSLDPLLGVQWRLDDGAWNELQPQTRELWEAPLADGELLKGEHTIEVAARERSGEVMARDAATFVFDPTGRYTPLPMVRPIVKKTAFC